MRTEEEAEAPPPSPLHGRCDRAAGGADDRPSLSCALVLSLAPPFLFPLLALLLYLHPSCLSVRGQHLNHYGVTSHKHGYAGPWRLDNNKNFICGSSPGTLLRSEQEEG